MNFLRYGGNSGERLLSLEEYAQKSLRNNPEYDENPYRINKKAELLRLYP